MRRATGWGGLWAFASTAVLVAALVMPVPSADADAPALSLPAPIKINRAQRQRLSPHIGRIARRHRLDAALLHAVISVESGYNPRAVSAAGAMGLMQLMPETAQRFGVDDPFDALANVDAGARYLRLLLKKFGTLQLALAAYHAGEGRVARGRNTIPAITATRKYVVSVIHHYMRYRKAGY